jgi:hypothetical protein
MGRPAQPKPAGCRTNEFAARVSEIIATGPRENRRHRQIIPCWRAASRVSDRHRYNGRSITVGDADPKNQDPKIIQRSCCGEFQIRRMCLAFD